MKMQVIDGGKDTQANVQGVRNLYAWVMNAGDVYRNEYGGDSYELEVFDEFADVNRPFYVYAYSEEEAKGLARQFILESWEPENPFRIAPIEILGVVKEMRALSQEEVGLLYGTDIGDSFEVTLERKTRLGLLHFINDPITGKFEE
ncbi:hypothetical protein GPJ61_00070 [Brevibacillus formosus]|uniref:hypothetical protein n=1 Tax=Brevibacillus formosus TaxID=54913 RepID=UPI001CA50D1D|nr:hypothetical protein [Brevibacillus formosus]MBW5466268.1 hypothetical protein [Brevibacillus formosus]